MLKRLNPLFFLFSSSIASAQSVDNPVASYAVFTNALSLIFLKVNAYINFNLSHPDKLILYILAFTIGYYLFIWMLYGKDSNEIKINNITAPLNDLTPAAMYFIISIGWCDEKTLSATFMSMVIKKFIKISDLDGEINLEKIGTDTSLLSNEEKIVNDTLFNQTTHFLIKKINVDALYQTNKKIYDYLTLTYPHIGHTNYYLAIPGGILLAIAYFIGVQGSPSIPPLTLNDRLIINIGILIFIFLALNCFYMLFYPLFNYIKTFDSTYLFKMFLLLSIGVLAGSIGSIFLMSEAGLPFMTAVLLLVLLTLNCLALIYLPQLSQESMGIKNKIKDFKSHLQTRENFNASEASQLTETAYEHLPYAIALDVDNRWGNQLNVALQGIQLPVVTTLNTITMKFKRNQIWPFY